MRSRQRQANGLHARNLTEKKKKRHRCCASSILLEPIRGTGTATSTTAQGGQRQADFPPLLETFANFNSCSCHGFVSKPRTCTNRSWDHSPPSGRSSLHAPYERSISPHTNSRTPLGPVLGPAASDGRARALAAGCVISPLEGIASTHLCRRNPLLGERTTTSRLSLGYRAP
jgi:hypothetical protein